MTLHVGMLGRDGWVLASDTQLFEENYLEDAETQVVHAVSYLSPTVKIVNRWDDLGLAYAFSGDNLTKFVGERLEAAFEKSPVEPKTLERTLGRIGDGFRNQVRNYSGRSILRRLTIMFARTPEVFWTLDISPTLSVLKHTGHAAGGQVANPAVFFPRQYCFNRDGTRRSVAELEFLAAHTILTASRLHPSLVNGLDVLTKRGDGAAPVLLNETEVQRLILRSQRLNEMMQDLVERACHLGAGISA